MKPLRLVTGKLYLYLYLYLMKSELDRAFFNPEDFNHDSFVGPAFCLVAVKAKTRLCFSGNQTSIHRSFSLSLGTIDVGDKRYLVRLFQFR